MAKNKLKESFFLKIKNKSLTCAVIGLGYVGLPLAAQIAYKGYKTIGFDVSEEKVSSINSAKNYIKDIDDEVFKTLIHDKTLSATTNFLRLKEADFIAICVPTPLDEHQMPDLSFIENAGEKIGKIIKKGTAVCLESTTYPGTTEEVLLPLIEKESGLKCREDFYLGFSPERIDPGNKEFKTGNTPKVIGGVGKDSGIVLKAVYESILDTEIYLVSSPKVAEMEKILENTYRNINIGLINEMAIVCEKLDISIWETIDAAKTKPYGFTAFYPGPGLGGHCIPLDPAYLSWKAKEFDYHIKIVESSAIINDEMPSYVAERIIKILNKDKKALKGTKVLILGVAYKNDIDDYRESPALEVIDKLEAFGGKVSYYDPYIKKYEHKGKTKEGFASLTAKILRSFDIAVITTAHSVFDYDLIVKNSKRIFDTRNAVKSKNRKIEKI
ncbi:MAG: nucleotide sugar dehydrogenase [Clostridiales Family XIII bacterium]|jgi:UDP-N-acetyl-D-glucosamine dehydrogenase|nr:nucleotide sugar dehydrogenase [Clostridiales Family XIII bacterium]